MKFSYSDYYLKNEKPSLLITFDDGLSDHYTAAKILHENNIKGVFFIPTCILEENLPANPMIIHYCIAIFGLKKFLELSLKEAKLLGISKNQFYRIKKAIKRGKFKPRRKTLEKLKISIT